MTAADTNVVVRLLTGDDPVQSSAARLLFESGTVWIAKTVLLEADWVLRSLYGFEQWWAGLFHLRSRALNSRMRCICAADRTASLLFLLTGCLCAAPGGRALQKCRA